MQSFNPLFDCPSAFAPFMDTPIDVSVHGVPPFTVRASVQLNARETAVAGDRLGDCWSVVFFAKDWPLAGQPDAGIVFTVPGHDPIYVYRAMRVESCWHVMACSRMMA